jgi:hypothetical protein
MTAPGYNVSQWPSHQQSLYKHVKAKNAHREAGLTAEQQEHLQALWMTEAEIYSKLAGSGTDYPDGLADVLARQRVLSIVEKSE